MHACRAQCAVLILCNTDKLRGLRRAHTSQYVPLLDGTHSTPDTASWWACSKCDAAVGCDPALTSKSTVPWQPHMLKVRVCAGQARRAACKRTEGSGSRAPHKDAVCAGVVREASQW